MTGRLPKDAAKFAAKMGVDLEGLEPEAAAIWAQLEKLSTSDPVEYERFVAMQMQLAKEEEESAIGKKDDKNRAFRPDQGYVFQVATEGGDGLKIREFSARKALYVNVCQSKVIEAPIDSQGKNISGDVADVDGPQIPLLVGPVRVISEAANAIDVVVNPQVMESCQRRSAFRQQLTALALQWVEEETDLHIKSEDLREESAVKYFGGLGEQADVPVLFHVTQEMLEGVQRQGKKAADAPADALASTSSLLSHLKQGAAKEEEAKKELITPAAVSAAKPAPAIAVPVTAVPAPTPAKSKIEEVGPTAAPHPKVAPSSSSAAPAAPAAAPKPTTQPLKSPPNKLEYEALESLLARADLEFGSEASLHDELSGDNTADVLGRLAQMFARTNPEIARDFAQSGAHSSIPDAPPSPPLPPPFVPSQRAEFSVHNPHPTQCQVALAIEGGALVVSLSRLRSGADLATLDIQASVRELRVAYDLAAFENPDGAATAHRQETLSVVCNGARSLNTAAIKAKLHKKHRRLDITVALD